MSSKAICSSLFGEGARDQAEGGEGVRDQAEGGEEERPRRARGTAEILRCYPVPIHFQNATLLNSQYYFTAQFPASGIHGPQPFTVGDNKTYSGY